MIARRTVLVALVLLAACGDAATAPDGAAGGPFVPPPAPSPTLAGRGDLVSAAAGPVTSRVEVGTVAALTGLAGAFSARFDARPFVVRYRTPGVNGQLTTASGVVWVPVGATGALPVTAYMHATLTNTRDAPSYLTSAESRFGALFASDGGVAVLPDYLGLGVAGEGTYHPYLHLRTQASSAIDLLRAARTLLRDQGVAADWRTLAVTGYSQGGGVAMAVVRELERSHAAEFPVLAGAPASGPYDLETSARATIDANPEYAPSVLYTLYLGETMRRVYQLADAPSALFAPPHDAAAAALVEGTLTAAQRSALPPRPRALFQPAALEALLADRDHPLWRALRDNNAFDWTPRATLRLFYGGADRDVAPQNALTAEARMRANGARNVAAVNLGATLDHGGAVLPAVRAVKLFVDSTRRALPPTLVARAPARARARVR